MQRREALITLGLGALALNETLFAATNSPSASQPATSEPASGIANGEFTLPPLPYDYKALEPHIDEQTMRLHHDKHHAAYVKGANKALLELKNLRDGKGDPELVKHWERELAFNGSGHILHTLFWRNMSPNAGEPSRNLMEAFGKDFGSLENFKKIFSQASAKVEASGWGMLAYHPMTKSLTILQIEKHQNMTLHAAMPLLVVDVWEHAYYLKYQNKRDEFITAWWNVVNWADVSQRYKKAVAMV